MSGTTCPNGHTSESSDYCDTCGAPIVASSTPDSGSLSGSSSAPAASGANVSSASTSTTQPCPNCALTNTADALFCEACGYDFTTGTLPRPTATATGTATAASPAASTNPLDLGTAPGGGARVPGTVAPSVT